MRVGIVSDIHGDLQQLDVAITLLHKEGVDQIICAGDLVDFGVDSIGVVNRILELSIPCIAGNHDRATRDNQRLRQRQLEQGVSVQLLDETTLNCLDRLPMTIRCMSILIARWFCITGS